MDAKTSSIPNPGREPLYLTKLTRVLSCEWVKPFLTTAVESPSDTLTVQSIALGRTGGVEESVLIAEYG